MLRFIANTSKLHRNTLVIINLIIIGHSRMIQAFRFIEISKYDDGGQLTTRGQLMQGSSSDVHVSHQNAGCRF